VAEQWRAVYARRFNERGLWPPEEYAPTAATAAPAPTDPALLLAAAWWDAAAYWVQLHRGAA
jgi:hypothetical protein